ncbi:MAG: alkaline phosphatase, partial [Candidatus Kariarchaeaceae archaeon]
MNFQWRVYSEFSVNIFSLSKKRKNPKKLVLAAVCVLLILNSTNTLSVAYDNVTPNQDTPKNIILMIGDGMGHEEVKLARWAEVGPQGQLNMEKLPIKLNVSTNNLYDQLTDSAASATAYATGSKTRNLRISVCDDGSELKTITEIAQELGMKTGLVTTARLTHATPAAFGSHEISRNNEGNIASQLIDSSIDVLLGGGASNFGTSFVTDIINNGYVYVETNFALNTISTGMIFGLFANDHMNYESSKQSTEPTLLQMTKKAIELLENPNGFFLMVEGGRIDHAGHDNNKTNNVLETINFDEAVSYAHGFAIKDGNTSIIVTADHETGGLEVVGENLTSPLPTSTNSRLENVTARALRANEIDVSWSSDYHTSVDVPFYGYGQYNAPTSEVIENTDIFTTMKEYIDPSNSIMASSPCINTLSSTSSSTVVETSTTTSPITL